MKLEKPLVGINGPSSEILIADHHICAKVQILLDVLELGVGGDHNVSPTPLVGDVIILVLAKPSRQENPLFANL